ncbi:coat protein [Nootka lupine vein clearing virus]|uniref:Capsid protein n=1 Tax=Nootka lupine vein clearing virus TaxID=283876 RepID=A2TJT2_9TOMB|nr:coat protein [Nootka lupine vein clearing virus]ABM92363.1 coat protein [Nootka lupine vein clearing virus]
MTNSSAITNHPATTKAAVSGVAWAVKLRSKGWASLTTAQKRAARLATGISDGPVVVVMPKRNKVKNPNNHTIEGQAGKSTNISKAEFISTVTGSTGSSPTFSSWRINPSDVGSFPTISCFANRFNQYQITSMAVRFSPARSFQTNGMISLAFTDDSTDPVPTSRQQMAGYTSMVSSEVSQNLLMKIRGDSKRRYIRDSTNENGKLVDFGRVILSVHGCDSGVGDLGDLYFEYTIRFSDPTFVQRDSQTSAEEEEVGPHFADFRATDTEWTATLVAPGNWVVSVVGSNVPDRMTIRGDGATGEVHEGGDSYSYVAVAVVRAQIQGAVVALNLTGGGKVTKVVVSRM